MYIVIGKIKEVGTQKLDACRIIDTETREVKDISLKRIRIAIRNGVKVQGFKKLHMITAKNKDFNVQTEVTKDETYLFKWKRVPELTGAGELVNEGDEKYMTVFGWHGFAEEKQYHLFNWEGKEVVFSTDEFIQKLKENEINGASFDYTKKRPRLLRDLNIEIPYGTGGNK